MSEKTTFEKLVKGITQKERIDLLEKLESISDPVATAIQTESTEEKEIEEDLQLKLKNESLFLRILIAIRSFFTQQTTETVYNDHLVASNAKQIEKNYPDLIDYRHGFLLTTFFNKLHELKGVADYFRPGIAYYEENPGEVYVFLGSLIIPEITEKIEKESDPYNLSFDQDITSDIRPQLMRKIEEILLTIPQSEKTDLYAAVQCLDWLRAFVRLPFERLSSRFLSIVNGNYTCPLDSAASDLETFAAVLYAGKQIYTEVLETLYFISKDQTVSGNKSDPEKYVEKSIEQISILKMFLSTVPIKAIAGVANHVSNFSPRKMAGVEDWFVKYKNQWRKIFDQKWEAWLHDRKLNRTKIRMQTLLGTDEYPLLPKRPWAEIWGGLYFAREYSIGFVNKFYETKYPLFSRLIKTITIEGEFAQREDRKIFTDSYNMLNKVSDALIELKDNLSEKGLFGSSFENIQKEGIRTIQGQEKIDSLLMTIASEASTIVASFCEASRNLIQILGSIVTESLDARNVSLTNISILQGKQNKIFKQQLSDMYAAMIESLAIIKELETLELNTIPS